MRLLPWLLWRCHRPGEHEDPPAPPAYEVRQPFPDMKSLFLTCGNLKTLYIGSIVFKSRIMKENQKTPHLLDTPLSVINVGLESFSEDLKSQNVATLHIDWSPPAGGDPVLGNLLSKLGA